MSGYPVGAYDNFVIVPHPLVLPKFFASALPPSTLAVACTPTQKPSQGQSMTQSGSEGSLQACHPGLVLDMTSVLRLCFIPSPCSQSSMTKI